MVQWCKLSFKVAYYLLLFLPEGHCCTTGLLFMKIVYTIVIYFDRHFPPLLIGITVIPEQVFVTCSMLSTKLNQNMKIVDKSGNSNKRVNGYPMSICSLTTMTDVTIHFVSIKHLFVY